MKVWEKALEKQIEEIKVEWKAFAESGDCSCIECRFCPVQCIFSCETKNMVERLNKEVEE